MNHLTKADVIAAAVPTGASITAKAVVSTLTLADWNNIAGIAGAALGSAYLLWKWRREARRGTRTPFNG